MAIEREVKYNFDVTGDKKVEDSLKRADQAVDKIGDSAKESARDMDKLTDSMKEASESEAGVKKLQDAIEGLSGVTNILAGIAIFELGKQLFETGKAIYDFLAGTEEADAATQAWKDSVEEIKKEAEAATAKIEGLSASLVDLSVAEAGAGLQAATLQVHLEGLAKQVVEAGNASKKANDEIKALFARGESVPLDQIAAAKELTQRFENLRAAYAATKAELAELTKAGKENTEANKAVSRQLTEFEKLNREIAEGNFLLKARTTAYFEVAKAGSSLKDLLKDLGLETEKSLDADYNSRRAAMINAFETERAVAEKEFATKTARIRLAAQQTLGFYPDAGDERAKNLRLELTRLFDLIHRNRVEIAEMELSFAPDDKNLAKAKAVNALVEAQLRRRAKATEALLEVVERSNAIDKTSMLSLFGVGLQGRIKDLVTEASLLGMVFERSELFVFQFSATLEDKMLPIMDQVANGFAQAAADAILFGDSMEEGVNRIAKALAREALVQGIMETAKGLAATAAFWFTADPRMAAAAQAHFASAAAFGAVAGVAAGVAVRTGGLSGGGGSASSPTARDAGTGSPGGGDGEKVINIYANFNGQPLVTNTELQDTMVRALNMAGQRRGSPRMNFGRN